MLIERELCSNRLDSCFRRVAFLALREGIFHIHHGRQCRHLSPPISPSFLRFRVEKITSPTVLECIMYPQLATTNQGTFNAHVWFENGDNQSTALEGAF